VVEGDKLVGIREDEDIVRVVVAGEESRPGCRSGRRPRRTRTSQTTRMPSSLKPVYRFLP
jgi:hypothetical protein